MIGVALNEPQQEAVAHVAGPMLVLAGAGSGKTRVLTVRLARLIDEHGVDPRHILAVTFTNKAAGEMKARVAQLLGAEPDGLWIGTFHAICARLLRREAPSLGFSRSFTIYDEDDVEALVRRLVDDLGLPPRLYGGRVVRHEISRAKNAMVGPEAYAQEAADPYHANVARVYAAMEAALRRANAMDFDDLLLHPLTLFAQRPATLEHYRARFRFLLVDEYQDTNRAQYLFLKSLAGEGGNLFVVGDDDQSIYGWRGADLRNILEFQRDFPGARLVRLEQNYRSTSAILEAANSVIAPNRGRLGKTLFTRREGGEPITVVTAADERDEAEWLVREFQARVRRGAHAYDEMAVLLRTNAQTRAFEDELRRSAVPYRVVGAVSFYERREVKDLLAHLRLVANADDDAAFRRAVGAPRRGIGEQSLEVLSRQAAQWGWSLARTAEAAGRVAELRPKAREGLEQFARELAAARRELAALQPAEALRAIVARTGFERYLLEEDETGPERVENVAELVTAAAAWSEEYGAEQMADGEGGRADDRNRLPDGEDAKAADPAAPVPEGESGESPIQRFLAQTALTGNSEIERGENGVTLMTLHAAKGLEFPVVAIAGLEEGLFPLSRADTPEALEEERRLCYVGVTRAKDKVFLTYATARRRGGELRAGFPSRFLDDVPPALAEQRVTRPSWGLAREPRRRPAPAAGRSLALVGAEEPDAAEVSDDAPAYRTGERVRHRRFGSGTIRRVEGRGRDLKVAVEFDDETVGLKQLLAAYAGLERDWV
ncbi:MAG TPA: UvrD-helicase domain-containing protein [Gemmatimonadales bacterium]|nr:UvrD-helicase domain-containing protein [Gemmatimonadales bacterium]